MTIIVLLILAGVTIQTLTGDNGLLSKAREAKEKSLDAEIEEEIRLAWNKVYTNSYIGNYTEAQKARELQAELIKNDNNAIVTVSGIRLIVNYKGCIKLLNMASGLISEAITATKAKEEKIVFTENTSLIDSDGIVFIVPKGFKLASDSAEKVTEGIVIEDAEYENTKGSQFVWIPVGIASKSNATEIIELKRYVFDSDGNVDPVLSKSNPQDQLKTSLTNWRYYIEGLNTSTTSNAHAKDINDFITRTNSAKGFYIGRYEARKNSFNKITEVVTDSIYNHTNQLTAALESQGMYASNNCFESDLINSFAWDTAILFLQEYDNRKGDNLIKYSRQLRTETKYISTGTTTDKICNVYDMAGNCVEWTTETEASIGSPPAVRRGGAYCISDRSTCMRESNYANESYDYMSFRPILYIK